MKEKTKYMKIEKRTMTDYIVRSKRNNDVLGIINYNKKWKQFVFEPEAWVMFSWDCLEDISKWLKELNNGKQ